ncbi:hypothetical protein F5Y16DRAFT_394480 [Xylariaceae sp. FL0255]|nr:hypothetical protein F5Y16DRAFT_394480 [Xylariaceae sp. FL0255]
MPLLSTPMTLAASGSILASTWVSGGIAALTICSVPAVLSLPGATPASNLIGAWHTQFFRGQVYLPTTAVAAALSYLYLAYQHYHLGYEWRGYAAAAASNVLLAPWTILLIAPINHTLGAALSRGVQGKMVSAETARALIARWGGLNFYRIFMPLGGALLGFWNLLAA